MKLIISSARNDVNHLIIKCDFHISFYATLSPTPTEAATLFFRWLAVAFFHPNSINLPLYDFCMYRARIGAMPLYIKCMSQLQSVLISHHHRRRRHHWSIHSKALWKWAIWGIQCRHERNSEECEMSEWKWIVKWVYCTKCNNKNWKGNECIKKIGRKSFTINLSARQHINFNETTSKHLF